MKDHIYEDILEYQSFLDYKEGIKSDNALDIYLSEMCLHIIRLLNDSILLNDYLLINSLLCVIETKNKEILRYHFYGWLETEREFKKHLKGAVMHHSDFMSLIERIIAKITKREFKNVEQLCVI